MDTHDEAAAERATTMSPLIQSFRKLARKSIDLARVQLVEARYKSVMADIQKNISTGMPVSVFFVVTQKQLWGLQSVYDEFLVDKRFVPTVVAMPNAENTTANRLTTARENMHFFSDRGMNVILGVKPDGSILSLNSICGRSCLCFFDQPWMGLPEYWSIPEISRQALLCYVPYGFKIANASQFHFNLPIHNLSWRVFAETNWHRQQFINIGLRNGRNVVVSGYPKFDEYHVLRTRHKKTNVVTAKSVIWAPHWSIQDKVLGYSTFDKYHEYFIQRAATEEGLQWIFKPHQKLKYHAVDCGFMTQSEIEDYYRYWTLRANTRLYNDPSYIDLFENSGALITDSGSFLAEYLPTGNPVLLLESDTSVGYNSLGDSIVASYYKARTAHEIDSFIEHVVLRGVDPLKAQRDQMVRQVMPCDEHTAGSKIKAHIETALELNC